MALENVVDSIDRTSVTLFGTQRYFGTERQIQAWSARAASGIWVRMAIVRTDQADTEVPRGKGRPPMTERRKDIIRLQIATAALELFKAQGVAATSGEQIADRLGISTRTLWRYCPSKEGCVQPLLTHAIGVVIEKLRAWPRDVPLVEHLLHESDLTEQVPQSTLDLARLTRTEPALRAVWMQTYLEAENAFAEAIAERTGQPADALETRVLAGMLNAALRIAVEQHAWLTADDPDAARESSMTDATRVALRTAIAGLRL
ncbi:transcriptional regulator, TetR family [Goodfellowiella coeruleoviolacea]|uniref:Transcriptional regulator, TetR family n=1 Tax=Goodfellowiella coeruleoviolacea TaxID=334858 RepID=A0AAE3KNF0_9PSEU|nr:transcriptional regulator, TetR family [Goodfellowiella coeruleoviolacea]